MLVSSARMSLSLFVLSLLHARARQLTLNQLNQSMHAKRAFLATCRAVWCGCSGVRDGSDGRPLPQTDSMRIMQENVALIKEINELRREIKALKQGPRPPAPGGNGKDTPVANSGRGSRAVTSSVEAAKEIEMQREEIRRLRSRLEELERNPIVNRPTSREKLPAMEGFQEGRDSSTPTG